MGHKVGCAQSPDQLGARSIPFETSSDSLLITKMMETPTEVTMEEQEVAQSPPSQENRAPEQEAETMFEVVMRAEFDSCTPLFKAIQKAQTDTDWHAIENFMKTGYWSVSFFTDPVSAVDQAKTWIMTTWNGRRQLPLHLAVARGAPFRVVKALAEAFPRGVRCRNDQSMLPIHLALRKNAPDLIVAFLLEKFPDAITVKGKDGVTTLECALQASNTIRGLILRYFVQKSLEAKVAEYDSMMANLSAKLDLYEAEYKAKLTRKDEEIIQLKDKMASMKLAEADARSVASARESTTKKVAEINDKLARMENEFHAQWSTREAELRAQMEEEFEHRLARIEEDIQKKLYIKEAEEVARLKAELDARLMEMEDEFNGKLSRQEEARMEIENHAKVEKVEPSSKIKVSKKKSKRNQATESVESQPLRSSKPKRKEIVVPQQNASQMRRFHAVLSRAEEILNSMEREEDRSSYSIGTSSSITEPEPGSQHSNTNHIFGWIDLIKSFSRDPHDHSRRRKSGVKSE